MAERGIILDYEALANVKYPNIIRTQPGDKTQLATVLFASKEPSNLLPVFAAASLALILSSGIAIWTV
jgi:hypothetical protein